jgi:hypothetical protein
MSGEKNICIIRSTIGLVFDKGKVIWTIFIERGSFKDQNAWNTQFLFREGHLFDSVTTFPRMRVT